jgi:hypothetical protein
MKTTIEILEELALDLNESSRDLLGCDVEGALEVKQQEEALQKSILDFNRLEKLEILLSLENVLFYQNNNTGKGIVTARSVLDSMDLPQKPSSCICNIWEWGNPFKIPCVCSYFKPSKNDSEICETCEHEEGCHTK